MSFEDDDEDINESPSFWRSLTRDAIRESGDSEIDEVGDNEFEADEFEEETYEPTDETCIDLEKWELRLRTLADRILWDRDFEMDYSFADAQPDIASFIKGNMGIEDGYYVAIAPDLTLDKVPAALDSIRSLARMKPR